MAETRIVTGGKILKGPKVTIDFTEAGIPNSWGPSDREPHEALTNAFASLDAHCAAMLFRANSTVLDIKGKKNEPKSIDWKPPKDSEELWEGDNWHCTGWSLAQTKQGTSINLSVTETLPNGKSHNSNVPTEVVGAEGGYEYVDDLVAKIKVCQKELLVYMDAAPVQTSMDFPGGE